LKSKKARTIGILGRPYVIDILESLCKKPLRFVDLKDKCLNDRTRANRLKELKKKGFIKTIIVDVDEQSFVHYVITSKGEKALCLLRELEALICSK